MVDGGRVLSLGWQAIVLYGVTSLVAVLATATGEVGSRMMLAVTVTCVAALVAFALARWVTGLASLLFVAGLTGLVRGLVLVGIDGMSGMTPHAGVMRVTSSVISALIWITVIDIVFEGRDRYRAQYTAAVRQLAYSRADESLDVLPEVIDMKAAIGEAAEVVQVEPTSESMRAAAAVLRAEIEERIRPLSHRIWFSAHSMRPHARIGRLAVDAIATFRVPVWPVFAVWSLSSAIGAPALFGTVTGLTSAVLCDGLLLAALLLARMAARRWPAPWLGAALLVSVSVIPVWATFVIVRALGLPVGPDPTVASLGFTALAIGALVVAAAAVSMANADREEILRVVEARTRPTESLPSVEVSSYLHNSLQSELSGLALQFDRADPGSLEAQVAIERLAALASRSIAEDFRTQRTTPRERLVSAAQAWRGIASVDVNIDPGLSESDPRWPLIIQAAEEVTSNAIRHGGARQVAIGVDAHAANVVVEVRTDGRFSTIRPAGMGTTWLEAVSAVPVVAVESATGTTVRVEV